MKIVIINGPNLNLLGKRESDLYGHISFEDFLEQIKEQYPGSEFDYFQSNLEGEIIDAIQRGNERAEAIILNPAGYTHTSVAIGDAVRACNIPVIEVHITNVYAREDYRKESKIAPFCIGTISGFGLKSYLLAIQSLFIPMNG